MKIVMIVKAEETGSTFLGLAEDGKVYVGRLQFIQPAGEPRQYVMEWHEAEQRWGGEPD